MEAQRKKRVTFWSGASVLVLLGGLWTGLQVYDWSMLKIDARAADQAEQVVEPLIEQNQKQTDANIEVLKALTRSIEKGSLRDLRIRERLLTVEVVALEAHAPTGTRLPEARVELAAVKADLSCRLDDICPD